MSQATSQTQEATRGLSPRALGLLLAALVLIADQTHKLWMLNVYDITNRQPVHAAPFLDLVMAWNPGISYSLFAAETATGRWTLLGVSLIATLALGVWMWRAQNLLTSVALGFVVGGALGNAYDRWAYGAVADFFHFFVDTDRWGRLSWYVFNIADVAIVAGVALLLYESFINEAGRKRDSAQPDHRDS